MSLFNLARPAAGRIAVPLISRQHISTTTRSLNNGGATRHGNDPEVLEKGKQDNLRRHQKGSTEAPKWNESIASDAEAFVKAQRDETGSTVEEISKMQQSTQRKFEKK